MTKNAAMRDFYLLDLDSELAEGNLRTQQALVKYATAGSPYDSKPSYCFTGIHTVRKENKTANWFEKAGTNVPSSMMIMTHSNEQQIIDAYDSETFVKKFIADFEAKFGCSESVRAELRDLYLISCAAGLSDLTGKQKANESMAQQIANGLHKKGFHLRVHAVNPTQKLAELNETERRNIDTMMVSITTQQRALMGGNLAVGAAEGSISAFLTNSQAEDEIAKLKAQQEAEKNRVKKQRISDSREKLERATRVYITSLSESYDPIQFLDEPSNSYVHVNDSFLLEPLQVASAERAKVKQSVIDKLNEEITKLTSKKTSLKASLGAQLKLGVSAKKLRNAKVSILTDICQKIEQTYSLENCRSLLRQEIHAIEDENSDLQKKQKEVLSECLELLEASRPSALPVIKPMEQGQTFSAAETVQPKSVPGKPKKKALNRSKTEEPRDMDVLVKQLEAARAPDHVQRILGPAPKANYGATETSNTGKVNDLLDELKNLSSNLRGQKTNEYNFFNSMLSELKKPFSAVYFLLRRQEQPLRTSKSVVLSKFSEDINKLDLAELEKLLKLMLAVQTGKHSGEDVKAIENTKKAFALIRAERNILSNLMPGKGNTRSWKEACSLIKTAIIEKLQTEKQAELVKEEYAKYKTWLGTRTGKFFPGSVLFPAKHAKEFKQRIKLSEAPEQTSMGYETKLTRN